MACGFHRLLLRECLETKDFLCIIGRGLGLDGVLSQLIKVCSDQSVVFFFNTPKEEAQQLISHVHSRGDVTRLPSLIQGEPQQERQKIYARGGIIFINAQVLVVDLLRQVVPWSTIGGCIVHHAHSAEEHSPLWLCLRLIRFHSSTPFLKCFSERAEYLQQSQRLESCMRNLLLSKLLLWPRFEARVADELNSHQPDVVDVGISLSPCMQRIHDALEKLVVAVVSEIQKTLQALELPKVTKENALSVSWHHLIREQLGGGQFLALRPKTRQLISDLASLKKMALFLLQYDCVMYNRFLETLRWENLGEHSAWLFDDAAEELFRNARLRVFRQAAEDGALELVLEPLPKWGALEEVLKEIRDDLRKMNVKGSVLVVCKDERTAAQVSGVLSQGSRAWLAQQWAMSLDKKMYRSRSAPTRASSKATAATKQPKTKKSKRATSVVTKMSKNLSIAELFSSVPSSSSSLVPQPAPSAQLAPGGVARAEEFEKCFGAVEDAIIVHASDCGISPGAALESAAPICVVMYDIDLAFMRALECYKSSARGLVNALRVYLLAYEVEAEENTELQSENEAFEQVIYAKASMVIEQERGTVQRDHPLLEDGFNSRIGRSNTLDVPRPYIVVDTREFMGSKITSKIWAQGFDVIPLRIDVGDYIISDECVIERKTVPDLISSFSDGRLFKQCQNMQQHYQLCVLLIEFHGNPFLLQSRAELTEQVSPSSLSSKLSLLVLHFPRLRILWSRDTAQSIAYILALRKMDKSCVMGGGPNMERITRLAVTNQSIPGGDDVIDATSRIFLSKLPGVFPGNIDAIMRRAGSLRKLFKEWNEEEYAPIMGSANAKAFSQFLDRRYRE